MGSISQLNSVRGRLSLGTAWEKPAMVAPRYWSPLVELASASGSLTVAVE